MGDLNIFKNFDTGNGVREFAAMPSAALVDVRTVEEYAEGHIPQSVNIPLRQIEKIQKVILDKNTPIFVYCRSGNRSSRATEYLQSAGYTSVKNIGGISSYNGKIEK